MRPPLVIVGPTACGKSALGLELAERSIAAGQPAEVVSADAKAVYRGMDIGTAKVTAQDRRRVPHHLVDIADPTEEYTVSQFAIDVEAVLADLDRREVQPILVGGTGLYVRAVVDGFTIPPKFPEIEAELEAETDTAALHRRLTAMDPAAATKMLPTNRRRIVRALEVVLGSGRPFSSYGPGVDQYPPTRFCHAGIEIDRDDMDQRIDERYDHQMAAGFVAEARALSGLELSRTAAQALGYREIFQHLAGEITLDEALSLARGRTKKFARRQQRWFRRDPRITWFDAADPDLVDQVENWWDDRA